jgi:N-acetylmuramoyl-L-alanine amidase
MKSKHTWILDPGHGGIDPISGQYVTAGKRSPAVPPGIFEGVFNRAVMEAVSGRLIALNINHATTSPGWIDTLLKDRVKNVKRLQSINGNCVLISIHANAAPGAGWSSARGTVVFTRRNFNQPENTLAEMLSQWAGVLTELPSRGVKRANFTMLVVPCPAVLIECGFMTNRIEAEFMASPEGVERIAESIVQTIVHWEAVEP